jgi:hypothetical protein
MPHPHTQVLASFSPASLFTKFEFFKWEMDKAFASDKMNDEVYYVFSTIFHEWIHQFQILSTSFGRELMFQTVLSGLFVGRTFSNYIKDGNFSRLRKPLMNNFRSDKKFRDTLTADSFDGIFAGILVNRYLGGDSNANHLDGPVSDLFSKIILPPTNTACPQFVLGGELIHFGGQHILEGFASINERKFIGLNFSKHILQETLDRIPKYPYYVAESFLVKELGSDIANLGLIRMLCDLALNGVFKPANPDEVIVWEDVHPGWRFVRAIDALKKIPVLFRELSSENVLDTRLKLCQHLGWKDPWGEHLAFNYAFEGYLPEAIEIRKDHPEAAIYCVEMFDELIKRFPFSRGYPPPPKSLKDFNYLFKDDKSTPEENFNAYMRIAMIAEIVNETLGSTDLTCPIHNVSLAEGNTCIEDCDFVKWFNGVMGISVADFNSIPLVSDEDLDRFKSETI